MSYELLVRLGSGLLGAILALVGKIAAQKGLGIVVRKPFQFSSESRPHKTAQNHMFLRRG
jgi:hypothetical protein